jgi:hypothetical protein
VNTRLTYLYRDASNYKQHHSVVFAGAITDEDRAALFGHLDQGAYFIPSQVGLEDLQGRFGTLTNDDHAWHELDDEEAVALTDDTAALADVHEFVRRFCDTTWDPVAAVRRLGIPT